MVKDEETIKADVRQYVANNGNDPSVWYAGVAEDAEDRLFQDHNVTKEGGAWIYRIAVSRDVADRIEKYLTDTLKMKGGPGGGSEKSVYVYAYKITATTKEN